MMQLIFAWFLVFLSITSGQILDLSHAQCNQTINGEVCFGGKERVASFSGQGKCFRSLRAMLKIYSIDIYLGCFMSFDCDIAVVGQLTSDDVVTWKLSAIIGARDDVSFWISPRSEKYRKYVLRSVNNEKPNLVRSCTIDIGTKVCADNQIYNGKCDRCNSFS